MSLIKRFVCDNVISSYVMLTRNEEFEIHGSVSEVGDAFQKKSQHSKPCSHSIHGSALAVAGYHLKTLNTILIRLVRTWIPAWLDVSHAELSVPISSQIMSC